MSSLNQSLKNKEPQKMIITSTPNKPSFLFDCLKRRYQYKNETPEQTVERISKHLSKIKNENF